MTIDDLQRSEILKPQLRDIEVQQILHQGAGYFLLRDSSEIATRQLLVPVHFGGLLALADGRRELVDLVVEARQLYHSSVDTQEAADLFAALDEAGMLAGGRYNFLHANALKAWRALPRRPMALAGDGYPAQRRDLCRYFQDLLENAASEVIPATSLDWGRGVGLLSPHIDYPRGGTVYAEVWQSMREAAKDADVAVILATDHKGNDPFTLTHLDYATPYGLLPTDTRLRDALVDTIGESAAYAGELRHRNEHSIELVVNWLHHMRGGQSLPIVPLLVGSLHKFIDSGEHPATDPLHSEVVATLQKAMQTRRVLLIASGDLAHVGPAFGGDALNAAGIQRLSAEDDRLLRTLQSGSADAFFAEIRRVGDRNNVCGVAPIYLASAAAAGVPGRRHAYEVAPADDANTSVVTIAGLSFT